MDLHARKLGVRNSLDDDHPLKVWTHISSAFYSVFTVNYEEYLLKVYLSRLV